MFKFIFIFLCSYSSFFRINQRRYIRRPTDSKCRYVRLGRMYRNYWYIYCVCHVCVIIIPCLMSFGHIFLCFSLSWYFRGLIGISLTTLRLNECVQITNNALEVHNDLSWCLLRNVNSTSQLIARATPNLQNLYLIGINIITFVLFLLYECYIFFFKK